MQNFVKVLTAKNLYQLLFFIFFFNLSIANEVTKFDFDGGSCLKLLNFHDCTFDNGAKKGGQIDSQNQWNKNVRVINQRNTFYYFYRSGDIGYGVKYFDNGYYVGDLSTNGDLYGLGTYYLDSGIKLSFQNWQDENKIGYIQYPDAPKSIGRFDKNYQQLIAIPLDKDFQLKLNNMEFLARSVEVDFKSEYENFLLKKRIFLSDQSSQTSTPSSSTNLDASSNSSYATNKKRSDPSIQNTYIGVGILFLLIVLVLWKNANPTKIKQTSVSQSQKPKNDNRDINRYKNLSLADSKKIFSYGVEEFMSVPEACIQLRSEYFKWTTVSNNPNSLKKSLSKKNMDHIIRLRKKLEC